MFSVFSVSESSPCLKPVNSDWTRMENSDEDAAQPQFLSRTPSVGSTVSPEPEQERQEEPAPDCQPGSKADVPSVAHIEFRIQQLRNRLLILQNAQDVKKRAADGVETDESESNPSFDDKNPV